MGLKLNKYQEEAVNHIDGPCLVTSCPGSGKTLVMVERVAALIKNGVRPKNILCLTFTNKASCEMKERIQKRLGVDKLDFFCGTFHSMCAKMIRKLGHVIGYSQNYTILDDKDQVALIMQIARRLEYNIELGDARKIQGSVNYYRDQMEGFGWVEDYLRTDAMVEIARRYIEKCREDNLIDFSGLIYEAIKIVEANEELKEKIQNTFKQILIDEIQDTNVSQFYLINLLAEKWKNIMIIGDCDQSIYKFRGARYQNIQDFINRYEDCRVISLSKNYRSTPQIVSTAHKLIQHNSSHMGTSFETDNEDGEAVRCTAYRDQLVEADKIGLMIRRLIDEGGWSFRDIAILVRMNKMTQPLETALVSYGISYEVKNAWNFYDRKEVKDCLGMLKFLSNPKDGIAFHRVCSLIKGLGNVSVGKIENVANEKNIPIPQACKEMANNAKSINIKNACNKIHSLYSQEWDTDNPASCLKGLVEKFEYKGHLLKKFKDTATEREDNVDQLIDSAGEFIGENGIGNYLQQVALVVNKDKDEEEKSKVSIMTLHSSKGLEYPIIFMPGVEQDILPHAMAMADNPVEGLEEERRLCYVGFSRAAHLLYISYCKNRRKFGKHGNMTYKVSKPSQFLFEAGLIKKNIKE